MCCSKSTYHLFDEMTFILDDLIDRVFTSNFSKNLLWMLGIKPNWFYLNQSLLIILTRFKGNFYVFCFLDFGAVYVVA